MKVLVVQAEEATLKATGIMLNKLCYKADWRPAATRVAASTTVSSFGLLATTFPPPVAERQWQPEGRMMDALQRPAPRYRGVAALSQSCTLVFNAGGADLRIARRSYFFLCSWLSTARIRFTVLS